MNIDTQQGQDSPQVSRFLSLNFWWRFLPGSLAALLIVGLSQIGTWQPLENLVCDLFFQLRGAIPWGAEVVVITMDESSMAHLGPLPWNRSYYADLLHRLEDADPAVVALDSLFPTPTADDALLADAMRWQNNVVLAQSWDPAGVPLLPTPALKDAATAIGYIAPPHNQEATSRQVALVLEGIPAFAYATAQRYAQDSPAMQLPDPSHPLWINWFGPIERIPYYSFWDVLSGEVPLEAFTHKVVMVGTTTAPNTLHTPYNPESPVNGILYHATVTNNVLHHNALHVISQGWMYVVLGLLAPVLGYFLTRLRFEQQLLAWSLICAGWFGLGLGLFYAGYWMPIAAPLFLFGLIGGGVVLGDQYWTAKLLQQSEERYALAVTGSNEGLWDWNLKASTIYFSPRWREMLGYGEAEVGDRPADWFDRVHFDDLASLKAEIDAHLTETTPHFEHEHRILHQDGSYRWVLSRGMAVRDRDGVAYRMAGSQTDITERKEAEEQLKRIALFDGLTELPNRAFFLDAVRQAIAHSKEQPLFSFAVFLLDVDRFQVVNNSLGNPVGDQLLVAIARRLKAFIAPECVVARLSGDEFGFLIKHVETVSNATRIAEQIQQILTLTFHLDGHEVFTTASLGITLSAAHYTQPEQMLRDADTALYRAKALGRARYQVFDQAMHTRMVAKLQIENDLRRAISHEERQLIIDSTGQAQELMLYYQPIIQLDTGKTTGFEALVRWHHPEQGFLSPAKFIATAEETGLIVPLGHWILREACQQMRRWQEQFDTNLPLTVSVNLASKQFSLSGLTEQIHYILDETGIDAARLKLEITESTIMDNARSVISTLHRLRSLGIQLAIDDFGTGYSSLSYLHRFPINTIKIDRSFVSRMSIDSENTEIVRTIVSLAHNLNMNVTAEGVEHAEQSHQLLDMGCEYGQGYFFAKPLDSQAATEFLTQTLCPRPTTNLTIKPNSLDSQPACLRYQERPL